MCSYHLQSLKNCFIKLYFGVLLSPRSGHGSQREPWPAFCSVSSGAPCCLSPQAPHSSTLPSLRLSHLPSSCLLTRHTLPPLVSLTLLLLCPLSFSSSPCRNMATCQDSPQGPRCLCPPGYTGGSCQVRGREPGVQRKEGAGKLQLEGLGH